MGVVFDPIIDVVESPVGTTTGTGPELFTAFSDWTLDVTFSGSGDTVVIDNTSGGQDSAAWNKPFVLGKDYVVNYTVSNYVDGNVGISFTSGSIASVRVADGTYTDVGTMSLNTTLYVAATNTSTADVTINSIREADHDV